MLNPMGFSEMYDLHENTLVELVFDPVSAELKAVFRDPIEGGSGKRTIVFEGVKHVVIEGSTRSGILGYRPGFEVLNLHVEPAVGYPPDCFQAKVLMYPQEMGIDTALNSLGVVTTGMRLAD